MKNKNKWFVGGMILALIVSWAVLPKVSVMTEKSVTPASTNVTSSNSSNRVTTSEVVTVEYHVRPVLK